ncbi:uncharacterized protein [Pyxicephalus adspersus]|uniref:uncharacterized protein isoform X6 n=2 Tax=Pyxicephalus adspersus TaxID=30357 RepID=UPI003B5CC789
MKMDIDHSHMTERILQLTLDIMYLLTGESFHPVMFGDQVTITLPPPHFMKAKGQNMQKILEVTQKMIGLLTGEVPIRCQDVTVYFSMEEWEYLEGHKDLYKDIMMEDHQTLTSPDGSSNGNPPERCPGPLKEKNNEADVTEDFSDEHKVLYKGIKMEQSMNKNSPEKCPRSLYSRDPTQKTQEIPHHHQNENLGDYNIVVKEEYKEEDEAYGVMKEHKEMMEPSKTRNPTERCTLFSIQEGPTIPHHQQSEEPSDFNVIKEEIKEEDIDDDRVTDESKIVKERKNLYLDSTTESLTNRNKSERCPRPPYSRNSTQEGDNHGHDQGEDLMDIKVEVKAEEEEEETSLRNNRQYTEEAGITRAFSGTDCKVEDEDITGPGEISTTTNPQLAPHHIDGPSYSSEEPRSARIGAVLQKMFSCTECGKCYPRKSALVRHQRSHTGEKPYSCNECGKRYPWKSALVRHQRSHTGEMLYSCSECGKCFLWQSQLIRHQINHTGKMPYSCPVCGKSCPLKSALVRHLRTHTGEKPYSCPECGKCFSRKAYLTEHQSCHTGEKPYSCSECGKRFLRKPDLAAHQRSHTGEKPYSCSECGKCFSQKSHLSVHQRCHSGIKPYSCPECGKSYPRKSELVKHQRSHTGEKPYSCSECGQSYTLKSTLVRHQRSHTGEKPYSCPECGKCFSEKSYLSVHQLCHTGEKPFSCSECGKCFVRKSDLGKHQRCHTGEKPYSCSKCGKCFSQQCSLAKHQRTHKSRETC